MTLEQAVAYALAPEGSAPPQPMSAKAAAPRSPAGLTTREVEVLRLVAQGLSNAQVAELLIISPRTVDKHLQSIYTKLDVPSRTAAVRYAMDQHLV